MRYIFVLLLLVSTLNAFAVEKGIYGADNRMNLFEAPSVWQEAARSVAVLIPNRQVIPLSEGSNQSRIQSRSHQSVNRVCRDESFSQEPSPAECSGFLVADDLMLTASHCMRFKSSINNYRWVFDYGYLEEDGEINTVSNDNVYRSVEIVERKVDMRLGLEYLLVKLDRPVVGRSPLRLRKSGNVSVGTPLTVIGSPSGLPLKVADGAFVREIKSPTYFVTNTDTFGGNSGSPVFNADSGEVEGILVRGDTDYFYDKESNCYRVQRCQMNECDGEDVVSIQNVDYLRK